MHILVDPSSGRIVYLARDDKLPDRIVIVAEGRQLYFVPSACRKIEYSGPLPDSLDALNCWNFRYDHNEITRVEISQ